MILDQIMNNNIEYNHDKPLSYFINNIKIIKNNGFNIIGVSQLYFEDVYIFESNLDATGAYHKFESNTGGIIGWWYSKEDFLKEVEEYESHINSTKVKIYWI